MTSLSFAEFDACFDQFTSDVFRLETLQVYSVSAEDERLRAFREGTPRPERSVRTSPWLRRIAVTTAEGKHWSRVHIVQHPLSEYLRYEFVGYVESQAVGEQIRIADRSAHPELAALGPDFWLFDADAPDAFVVLMRYDDQGHMLDFEHTVDDGTLRWCRKQRTEALERAVRLNAYLANHKNAVRRAE